MGFKSLYLVIWTFVLISSIAYGQTSFSDEDLNRYKEKPLSDQGAGQSREKSGGSDSGYSKPSDNKALWCQQGEQARSEISKANKNAAAAQENYDGIHEKFMTRKTKTRVKPEEVHEAKKQLDAAIDAVDQAKKALELLESEAYRNGIPPGWLKCNFN